MAPVLDAEVCAAHAEDGALILFHDLAAPAVAATVDRLREMGWQTVGYHTTQVVGAAWRGSVAPVAHTPDPPGGWKLPEHLRDRPTT